MKKMVAIILILLLIFIAMIMYKNIAISTKNNISLEEIEKIETYITKIYMWKEITKDALPTFEDINNADDLWVWEVVKKNIEEYELSYETIENKAKELFGPEFTKEFPETGNQYLIYDEQTNKYYAIGLGLDEQEDNFLLNKIEKTQQGYEVEIIEYLEDYSNGRIIQTENQEYDIIIRNLEQEQIEVVKSNQEEQVKEIVKNNVDRFTKKKIEIVKNEEQIYVKKVRT